MQINKNDEYRKIVNRYKNLKRCPFPEVREALEKIKADLQSQKLREK